VVLAPPPPPPAPGAGELEADLEADLEAEAEVAGTLHEVPLQPCWQMQVPVPPCVPAPLQEPWLPQGGQAVQEGPQKPSAQASHFDPSTLAPHEAHSSSPLQA